MTPNSKSGKEWAVHSPVGLLTESQTMKKYPKKLSDFPNVDCYCIMYERSVQIPGDERSRTNPGHGYPAYTEEIFDIVLFANADEWKKEIISLESSLFKRAYKAFKITPAQLNITVNVDVK
jgi:hypothetical protein